MCNRYAANIASDEIQKSLSIPAKHTERSNPRTNVAPNTFNPIIRLDNSQLTLDYFKWGLSAPAKISTFNCRVESLREMKPLWKCAKTNRAVAIMDGYYEWQYDSIDKTPHYYNIGERAYALAIWESENYSIVTKPATKKMSKVHPRMPVLVDFATAKQWIEGTWPHVLDLIEKFIEPTSYRVSTKVNKIGNQGADLNKPIKHMVLDGWVTKAPKNDQPQAKKAKIVQETEESK